MKARRHFLLQLGSLLLASSRSMAYPLDHILGRPPSAFVRLYLSRFFKWYQKEWFDFASVMSPTEKDLWQHWLTQVNHFGADLGNGIYLEHFLTRHTIDDQQRHSGTYYAGLTDWDAKGRLLVEKFMSEKVPRFKWQPWQRQQLFGWSHNFANHSLRLWFLKPRVGDFFDTHKADLGFIEFAQGRESKRGVVFYTTDLPERIFKQLDSRATISGFRVLDSLGTESWKVRTRSTFLLSLRKELQRLSARHQKEFKLVPDFLDVGQAPTDTLKVYYP